MSGNGASQRQRRLLSVITPAFNEEENIPIFYERVSAVMQQLPYDYEIIVVENGSTDGSLPLLRRLHATDPRLKYVSLTRNFGHQGGILTGLHHARGDAVITMDADLQHPPEFIPKLVEKWEEGFLVVHAQKNLGSGSFGRTVADRLFYQLMNRMTGLTLGQADFRLIDRRVVNQLVQLPETEKFLRGLIAWFGFKETHVPYVVGKRTRGKSKFLRRDLINMSYQAVTSFSTVPLKMLTFAGFFFFIPAVLYMLYVIGVFIVSRFTPIELPAGWATLTVAVIFFGSIQLLGLGLLGEYVGRIYSESKRRPEFIVSEWSDDERVQNERVDHQAQ